MRALLLVAWTVFLTPNCKTDAPLSVKISTDETTVNLCSTAVKSIDIFCDVPVDTVNPTPTVILEGLGNGDMTPTHYSLDKGKHRFKFSYRVKTGGILTARCVASNDRIPNFKAEDAVAITVIAPPSAPTITIDGQSPNHSSQSLEVTSGQTVQCRVQGGSPPVTNVAMVCASRRFESKGTQVTVTITLDRTNNQDLCFCEAHHWCKLYRSKLVSFIVSYGPGSVDIITDKTTVTLCPDSAKSIDIFCDVPVDTVNPTPTVILEGLGNGDMTPTHYSLDKRKHRFKFSYRVKTGGILTARCVASNDRIPNFKAEDAVAITVIEPPLTPPILSIEGKSPIPDGQSVDVTSGQTVQVQCQVQGGFPPVTNVSMVCAGQRFESDGTQVSGTTTLNTSDNVDPCSCTAVHSTGCYDVKAQFKFNIEHGSLVTDYLVTAAGSLKGNNSNSTQLEVEAGTRVSFLCEAVGHPRPDVKIRVQGSPHPIPSNVIPSGEYRNSAVTTKTMTCVDTAFYLCEANNGIGTSSRKAYLVLVKCAPQFQPGTSVSGAFTVPSGGDLETELPVEGHPAPSTYALSQVSDGAMRLVQSVQTDRYDVTYARQDELHGNVTLHVYGLEDSDRGQYELTIRNGVGDGLSYAFYVDTEDMPLNLNNVLFFGGIVVVTLPIAIVVVALLVFLPKRGFPGRPCGGSAGRMKDDVIGPTSQPSRSPPHQEVDKGGPVASPRSDAAIARYDESAEYVELDDVGDQSRALAGEVDAHSSVGRDTAGPVPPRSLGRVKNDVIGPASSSQTSAPYVEVDEAPIAPARHKKTVTAIASDTVAAEYVETDNLGDYDYNGTHAAYYVDADSSVGRDTTAPYEEVDNPRVPRPKACTATAFVAAEYVDAETVRENDTTGPDDQHDANTEYANERTGQQGKSSRDHRNVYDSLRQSPYNKPRNPYVRVKPDKEEASPVPVTEKPTSYVNVALTNKLCERSSGTEVTGMATSALCILHD